jgi:hypothetical protein
LKSRRSNPNSRPTRRPRRFEALEPRYALDGAAGTLVGVDPHFTLSFAPDGTPLGGQFSGLAADFNAIASTPTWREAILRGFQTWAVLTNADIGVVADGGQPFGFPGASQADARFGDIRIGGVVASSEVGAVSVPVNNLLSGTWLADVLFNTNFDYQTIDEILAIAMHEAGNVFGLKDSTDPNSPLFTQTSPTMKQPTATDIANLQALHGVRAADANEVHTENSIAYTNNDSALAATPLVRNELPGHSGGSAPSIVYGDITTNSDRDYFLIDTPGGYTGSMTVSLRSLGISLLMPEVTLLNAAGQELATATAATIGGSELVLNLPSIAQNADYYVRVEGAEPGVFGIGGYSLTVTYNGVNQAAPALVAELASGKYRNLSQAALGGFFDNDLNEELLNDDGHSDDSAELGLDLNTAPGFAPQTRYQTIGSIADATDRDHYVIKSANVAALDTLTVAIRSLESGGLRPQVRLLDEDLQPVAATILASGAGDFVIQATGIERDKDYVLEVRAADANGVFNTGNYELTAVASADATPLTLMASGAVGGAVNGRVHTLYVARPQLMHFALETGAAATSTLTAVVATVRNSSGGVVATIAASRGDTRSLPAVLLNPGEYTVELVVRTLDGSSPPSLTYALRGRAISDLFVGDPNDPTTHPFAHPNPELGALFLYPGNFASNDPFLWDNFVESLPEPPPLMELGPLVNLLVGDWWSWVWNLGGGGGRPLAQDDTRYTVRSQNAGAANGNALGNDFDPEQRPLVTLLQSGPTNGTLSFSENGAFTYTPTPGFVGTDRFTYIAYNFATESAPATVRIVVTSGLAGDYDASGAVNAADRAKWLATFGSRDELLADGNQDGVVDAADYSLWRDNIGASLPGAAAAGIPVAIPVSSASLRAPMVVAPPTHRQERPNFQLDARDQALLAWGIDDADGESSCTRPKRAARRWLR